MDNLIIICYFCVIRYNTILIIIYLFVTLYDMDNVIIIYHLFVTLYNIDHLIIIYLCVCHPIWYGPSHYSLFFYFFFFIYPSIIRIYFIIVYYLFATPQNMNLHAISDWLAATVNKSDWSAATVNKSDWSSAAVYESDWSAATLNNLIVYYHNIYPTYWDTTTYPTSKIWKSSFCYLSISLNYCLMSM